jgi:hypothetical protein
MHGFCKTVEEVTALLVRLERPAAQIEAVRRTELQGVEQQIGGHGLLQGVCGV